MGREREEFIRSSGLLNAEKLFVLAYEGEETEKRYFSAFRKSDFFNNSGLIEIYPTDREKSTGTDPKSVKRRLNKIKTEVNFKTSDEFWLIIDRDDWQTMHKIDIDKIIEECNSEKNFFVALSNPCFEVWLLLHYVKLSDIDLAEQEMIFNNEKISNSKNYIALALERYLGKPYTKKMNMQVYMDKIYTAIVNSKELSIENETYPHSIGTDVYKLLEKLVK